MALKSIKSPYIPFSSCWWCGYFVLLVVAQHMCKGPKMLVLGPLLCMVI